MDRDERLRQLGRYQEILDKISVLETKAENALKTIRRVAYPYEMPLLKVLDLKSMKVALQELEEIKAEHETLQVEAEKIKGGLGIGNRG